ncbi:UNVERIFIED_ORG: hypothetical protein E4P37_03995 [Bacillus sp. AZ43]
MPSEAGDRRRAALALLFLFVLCTGVALVVGGSRPALEQGLAPSLVQSVGYLGGLAAGLLLVIAPQDGPRRLGGVVLGAVVVLVVLDLVAAGGTNIGAGLLRTIGLFVIMVAMIRLALGVAASGRTR